jgi:hypothetical protein
LVVRNALLSGKQRTQALKLRAPFSRKARFDLLEKKVQNDEINSKLKSNMFAKALRGVKLSEVNNAVLRSVAQKSNAGVLGRGEASPLEKEATAEFTRQIVKKYNERKAKARSRIQDREVIKHLRLEAQNFERHIERLREQIEKISKENIRLLKYKDFHAITDSRNRITRIMRRIRKDELIVEKLKKEMKALKEAR